MATEPTLEQLSAYIDGELDAAARTELETHLETCSGCRTRLEGLRQTVSAIRSIPMETPPRAFAVPTQRRQSWRWAPVGWIGGTAAALLVMALGISQLHGLGGGGRTASNASVNAGPALVVAPLAQSGAGAYAPDHSATLASKAALLGPHVTVTAPGSSTRSLTLSTDSRSYAANAVVTLRVEQSGLTSAEASTVRILLSRDGYAVRLGPPANQTGFPMSFEASYSIKAMPLPTPRNGTYLLQVTVDLANGSSLVAELPVAISP